MQPKHILLLSTTASAFSFPSVFGRRDGGVNCPDIWGTISSDLTTMFLTGGQCNDNARAAIRLNFHDCGAWETKLGATGGCDGSLILSNELSRKENSGLQDIAAKIQALAVKRNVGIADLIVFAGSHAVVTCPGGPQLKTWIGRNDSSTAAPDGLLPDVNAGADSLFQLFQNKGFNDVDLAALLGAHSTSKQFGVDTARAGTPQDTTPGVWDVKYYSDTVNPPSSVFVFPSDAKLANHTQVGKQFRGFQNNQGKWNGKFADAMQRMNLFGVKSTAGMADCTNKLPRSTNIKRELKAMPINGRSV
ncbi:heme peroxidase [Corynespora cassiicola Philippines]|uniref:Peroxidase n=1 Tax=Corynespora cassiicola Philippines TaxID=1448308 RepID=A0A2T2NI53_CORCC|nr:heme peroxidase [Corynespora cassiicola Philippines]